MMRKQNKLSTKLLSLALATVMAVAALPLDTFAVETDGSGCHLAHDESCGYIDTTEGVLCAHLSADRTYSCVSTDAGEEYACLHEDECGFAAAETPCTHNCELCEEKDNSESENSRKTEESSKNEKSEEASGEAPAMLKNTKTIVKRTIGLDLINFTYGPKDKDGNILTSQDGIFDRLAAEGWRWDSNTLTLTLNGVNIETTNSHALLLPQAGAVTIVLEGENTLVSDTLNTLTAWNDLHMTGTGSLNVICKEYTGIMVDGNLTITGGAFDVSSEGTANPSEAIWASGNINILGGDITAKSHASALWASGDMVIDGGKIDNISVEQNAIGAAGTLTIQNGAEIEAESNFPPLYSGGDMSIVGSTVNVSSEARTAINSAGNITFTDSNITAKSILSDYTAIYAGKTITINGSSQVCAEGDWRGIHGNTSVIIKDTAQVDATGENNDGIYSQDVQISDSAVVKAAGWGEQGAITGIANLSITGSPEVDAIGDGYGIYAEGSLVLSGKSINAYGEYENAIFSSGDITIGGKLTAESNAYFAISSQGTITADNKADITANGLWNGGGIQAEGDIILNGSKVDASATEDDGIYSGGTITINGGSVHCRGAGEYVAIRAKNVQTSGEAAVSKIALNDLIEKNGAKAAFCNWYDFKGDQTSWTTFIAKEDETLISNSGTGISNGLPEVWLASPYTVSFDVNGGSGTNSTVKVYPGNKVSAPGTEPIKDGFYFGGWYLDSTEFDFTNTEITSDITLKAKFREKTDAQKVIDAKKEVIAALYSLAVSNTTTAEDILNAVTAVLLNGVTADFKSGAGFAKTLATTTENGKITGTIELILNSEKQEVIISKVISKLAKTDAEKVTAAKGDATAVLYNFVVSNDTTGEEILNSVNAVMSNGVTAGFKSGAGFTKTRATTSQDGKITGTIELKLNDQTQEIIIDKVIAKLPTTDAEKVNAAKVEATAAIYNFWVSNTTTAAEILDAVNAVMSEGVTASWKTGAGFTKINATTIDSGSITGTMELNLNSVTQEIAINKVLAKLPETDAEKVTAAKGAATAVLYGFAVSNDTTAEQILNAVNDLLADGVSVLWKTNEGFTKTSSTTSEDGKITGTLKLSLKNETQEICINKVIAKLPKTDTEKVSAARTAAAAALYHFVAANSTTADQILNTVAAVMENGVIAGWKAGAGFEKTVSTTSNSGSITGTVELKLNSVTQEIAINKVLAKLPKTDAEKVNAVNAAATKALYSLAVTNDTTADQILNAVNAVLENGVTAAWKSGAGFRKIPATTSDSGSITGTLELALNGVKQYLNISRVMEKLPASDEEKVSTAKNEAGAALNHLLVNNDTTEQSIVDTLNPAMSFGVTAFWKSGDGFKKVNATTSENGSITGTLELKLNGAVQVITVYKVIAKLPKTDAEKVSTVKSAVVSVLYGLSVDNSTTGEDVLRAVSAAAADGVSILWKNGAGFHKTAATTTNDGWITGTLELSLNDSRQEVVVNKMIGKLPSTDTEKLILARAEVIAAIDKMFITNDVTGEDILSAVRAVLSTDIQVSWKSGFEFNKTNATTSESGSVTGTVLLTLNGKSQEAAFGKSIARLPKTDEEKTAAAREEAFEALYKLEVTNATTAENVLYAVNAAIPDGIKAEWKGTDGFKKKEATTSQGGSILGTIELGLNGAKEEVTVYKLIEKLPETDAEKIAEDKMAAMAAIYQLQAENTTRSEEVLSAVKAAMANGSVPSWKAGNGFQIKMATESESGSITGIITLTLHGERAEVTVKKDIQKLAYAGPDQIRVSLVTMIQRADGKIGQGQGHITSASWSTLQTAVANAKKVNINGNATRFDCLNALEVLTRALDGLKNYTLPGKNRTYTVGNLRYQVVQSSDNGSGTVKVKSAKSKNYTSITIPSNVKINSYTFRVTAVSQKAFYRNHKLIKVTIGKNVSVIERYAFYGCSKLSRISFSGKKLETVGTNAFKKTGTKAVIKVPASKYNSYQKLLKGKGLGSNVRFTK